MRMIISAALIATAIVCATFLYLATGPRYEIVAGSGGVWVLDRYGGYSRFCTDNTLPCPPPPVSAKPLLRWPL